MSFNFSPFTFNTHFLEVRSEIWAIQEYFETTERQLPLLIERENQRVREELENADADEGEQSSTFARLFQLTETVLPRYFRGQIIVALWAIYESAVTEVAEYLKKEGGHKLGLDDIKGRTTLEAQRKYFDRVLKFDLYQKDQDASIKETLDMLLTLRHVIAHGNGREKAVKNEETLKNIRKWAKAGKGVSFKNDYLDLSSSFVREILKVVNDSLLDLVYRAMAWKASTSQK